MRTKYLLLSLFLISTSITFAQWTLNYSLAGGYYAIDAVHFIDNNTGFIGGLPSSAGASTKIKKTTNGGTTWTDVATVNSGVRDITFVNSNLGFAVGDGGLIAKTTDGGNNWSTQYYTNPNTFQLESFESVYFTDANTGYIAGGFYEMWVLKTTDGGANWTPLTMPAYFQRLKSIFFTNQNVGYVVSGDDTGGGLGKIYKTINGGSTWDSLSPGISNQYFKDVFFSDANNGVVSCVSGVLLHTTNGGTTWTQVTNPTGTEEITEFSFVDSQVGYASTLLGKVIKTTDGGVNWSVNGTLTTMNAAYSISVPTYNFGVTGGLYGMYGVMNNPTGINESASNDKVLIYPNPTSNQLIIDNQTISTIKIIEIIDITGKTIKEIQPSNTIDVANLASGVYFIKLISDEKSITQKFIKE
jgi:photosystem II stability/assembly factor-like uncharacterized protein